MRTLTAIFVSLMATIVSSATPKVELFELNQVASIDSGSSSIQDVLKRFGPATVFAMSPAGDLKQYKGSEARWDYICYDFQRSNERWALIFIFDLSTKTDIIEYAITRKKVPEGCTKTTIQLSSIKWPNLRWEVFAINKASVRSLINSARKSEPKNTSILVREKSGTIKRQIEYSMEDKTDFLGIVYEEPTDRHYLAAQFKFDKNGTIETLRVSSKMPKQ